VQNQFRSKNKLSISSGGLMGVAVLGLLGLWSGTARAQASTDQAATAEGQAVPVWVTAAGGKAAFEVASVREDPSGKYLTPPYSLDSDNDYTNAGGLFTAVAPLSTYISFAYKLDQMHSMLSHLPEWANKKRYAIQARVEGNPTKDQVRLMMQSLLADRFKLALHFETQETPVLIMTLTRPGKMGPGLRLHADGPACNVIAPRPAGAEATIEMLPCNLLNAFNRPDNVILAGARNTTPELMAAFFSNVGHMGPIVDRTGISGTIDFAVEYTPERRGAPAASPDGQAEVPGTTLEQAVKDQLGLKLEPANVPLAIPVVDHVELPSEN
jgi:uncharacterized protein (TIGR03435 family)